MKKNSLSRSEKRIDEDKMSSVAANRFICTEEEKGADRDDVEEARKKEGKESSGKRIPCSSPPSTKSPLNQIISPIETSDIIHYLSVLSVV